MNSAAAPRALQHQRRAVGARDVGASGEGHHVHPRGEGRASRPHLRPEHFTLTKMGIDATRPAGREFAERLTIPDDQRARARSILAAAGVKL